MKISRHLLPICLLILPAINFALVGCGGTNAGVAAASGLYVAPIDLGVAQTSISGGGSNIVGLTAQGHFVANTSSLTNSRFWSAPDGISQSLPKLGLNGHQLQIMGVNGSDSISGTDLTANPTRTVYWGSPTTSPATLLQFATGEADFAVGINEAGGIVGGSSGTPGSGLYWTSLNNPPQKILALSGDVGMRPTAISSSGHIIGISTTASLQSRSAYWANADAQPVEIATASSLTNVFTTGVDNGGQIVGGGKNSFGSNTALIWAGPSVAPVSLPRFVAESSLTATNVQAINNSGTAVGSASVDDAGTQHAVIWRGGLIQDLNNLIPSGDWTLRSANFINDNGVIIGSGNRADHPTVWKLFVIIPE